MFEKYSNSFLKDFDFNVFVDRFNQKSFLSFQKDDKIYSRGMEALEVYFIISGEVSIGNDLPGGRMNLKYKLSAGDILGIDDALRNEKYIYSAYASKDTNVMAVPKEELISINNSNDDFNMWLLNYLSRRISSLE
ncbi:MAG: Crp/Fnr family transcriptional regulator [Bacteroidetes bacterium]|nr:Crp/Fnr family transcriptional regulator [Bacteroidota bacterium]